jgi:hypothetical protein
MPTATIGERKRRELGDPKTIHTTGKEKKHTNKNPAMNRAAGMRNTPSMNFSPPTSVKLF